VIDSSHTHGDPVAWVRRFQTLIPAGGIVLDVACGNGRHSRFLAKLGYRICAVDRDVSGVEDLIGTAGIEVVEADLETQSWPFAGRTFDGIVVVNYLYRPLVPHLRLALADGGVLIYQTFARGNEKYGRPRNPDFLLQDGELLDMFGDGLRVVAYESGLVEGETPAVVQRLCAINRAPDAEVPPVLPLR